MKRILITGKNSYIGTSFENWLKKNPDEYQVESVGTKNGEWKEVDFSQFDVVFHVAGIAHQDTKADQEELYYKVNRDLTIEIASKAKQSGIKQFIFMSSMIVYGASSKMGEEKIITKETIPAPVNFYGNSKLQAEEGLNNLESAEFNIAIVRPPMIYGKDSRGNYPILAKFARVSPIFPNIANQRSMLHIDNLCEFIRLLINNNEKGVFFPQNKEYVKTSEMVKFIGEVNNKKIYLVKSFNPLLNIFKNKISVINKVFGNLSYDLNISEYKEEYRVNNFVDSIRKTESKDD